MAKQPFYVVFTSFLCLQICYSFPQNYNVNTSLSIFVLDGKKDCKLGDTNTEVIKIFKSHLCPEHIKVFSDNYFDQREILPCFGVYDALYHLCEFPRENIDFKVPEIFKDPKQFCFEAKRVYKSINFTYSGTAIMKWSGALNKTMQDEKHCNNLCVMDDIVNEHCIAMLTFANEYLRLKDILRIKFESSKFNVAHENIDKLKPGFQNKIMAEVIPNIVNKSNVPAVPKLASKTDLSVDPDLISKTGVHALNKTSTSSSNVRPDSTNKHPQQSLLANSEKNVGEDVFANSKTLPQDAKTDVMISGDLSPVSVTSVKTDGGIHKDENTLKNNNGLDPNPPTGKNLVLNTSPEPNLSHIQKIPSDDGLSDGEIAFDDLEKTVTPQAMDDAHVGVPGENEEGIPPPDAREKGFDDEESEKPNEEEKTAILNAEQHVVWPGRDLKPIRDSFAESEDSYSFTYIVTTLTFLCAVYLLFHFRNKLLALALEGRKGRNSRGRGRPSSANYSKLHSNLEEAIASNISAPSATHVLY